MRFDHIKRRPTDTEIAIRDLEENLRIAVEVRVENGIRKEAYDWKKYDLEDYSGKPLQIKSTEKYCRRQYCIVRVELTAMAAAMQRESILLSIKLIIIINNDSCDCSSEY